MHIILLLHGIFQENGDCIEEDYMQDWLHLFKCYNVYCKMKIQFR